jgi:glycogen debranching enzyme
VWPLDNAICAAGLARYGLLDAAHRVIVAQLAVAGPAGGQLPELFAGFERAAIPVPAAYPASCSPQAWAAAAPLLWLRTMLGLDPGQPHGVTWLHPSLPPSMNRLRIGGLRVGDATLTVTVEGDDFDVDVAGDLPVVRERRGPVSAILDPS